MTTFNHVVPCMVFGILRWEFLGPQSKGKILVQWYNTCLLSITFFLNFSLKTTTSTLVLRNINPWSARGGGGPKDPQHSKSLNAQK